MIKHPLRCETCKKDQDIRCPDGDTDSTMREQVSEDCGLCCHSASSDVMDELMKWICDCDGGDVAFNPKLGLFSSPQPFNTIGLIHKIAELRQQNKGA